MKRLPYFFACLLFPAFLSAQFNVGESIRILQVQEDDLYLAGGEVSVDAAVYGDILVAGGQITLNDSVGQDVIVAGGEININGKVGDDVRVAGGRITINSEVFDDLIVFGGDVLISETAIIHGDLVSFAGKVKVRGTILGAMKASGGEVELDGTIRGPSEIRAGSIDIGERAQLHNDVHYWTEDGEIDFGKAMVAGQAHFDPSMAWRDDHDDEGDGPGAGFAIFGGLMLLISGLLLILLLNWAFGKWFGRAAEYAKAHTVQSLGYGLIYLILFPLLILLCLVTIVGIPIGLIFLFLYILSLVISHVIVALIIAHWFNKRSGGNWSFWKVSLIALLLAIAVRLIIMIPILGFIVSLVVVAVAFGAIAIAIREHRRTQAVTPSEV